MTLFTISQPEIDRVHVLRDVAGVPSVVLLIAKAQWVMPKHTVRQDCPVSMDSTLSAQSLDYFVRSFGERRHTLRGSCMEAAACRDRHSREPIRSSSNPNVSL